MRIVFSIFLAASLSLNASPTILKLCENLTAKTGIPEDQVNSGLSYQNLQESPWIYPWG